MLHGFSDMPSRAGLGAASCEANAYLQKHQLYPRRITVAPSPQLGMVVVVPCHDEPDLVATLASLRACRLPPCHVEVIVVVNGSDADDSGVRARNRRTCLEAWEWAGTHGLGIEYAEFRVFVLEFPDLPARHAGVGLARKLGMDEAVGRFSDIGRSDGVIVSLDADCTCERNYLQSIWAYFDRHTRSPGCSIYFEHPLDASLDAGVRDGILRYELFLRYYKNGLGYSGLPFAYFTIGSCMAVKASAYETQGGMNRRKAGEDFYFLQKVIMLGDFGELCGTRVIPSARISHRVPFGTGAAVRAWAMGDGSGYPVYAPEVFQDLRCMVANLDALLSGTASGTSALAGLPPSVRMFLDGQRFPMRLAEMRANAASQRTLRKRFYQWFNPFRAMKYVHWCTDHMYPRADVAAAAATLLRWRRGTEDETVFACDPERLLREYRRMDRGEISSGRLEQDRS